MSEPNPNDVPVYSKLIRPSSGSIKSIWNYFGYPANTSGRILSRNYIICTLCSTPLTHAPNSTPELTQHLRDKHPDTLSDMDMVVVKKVVPKHHTPYAGDEYIEESENVEYLLPDEPMDDDADDPDEVVTVHWQQNGLVKSEPVEDFLGVAVDVDLTQELAEMCIADLLGPELVDGIGFRGLVDKLRPGQQIPDSKTIWQEITRLDAEAHATATAAFETIQQNGTCFALGIERWTNVDATVFYSVSVYFESEQNGSIENIFTITGDAVPDWKTELKAINLEACTAAVLNFDADSALSQFLRNNDVAVVKCLSSAIHSAIERALSVCSIDQLINDSQAQWPTSDHLQATHEFWLSQFAYMEQFIIHIKTDNIDAAKEIVSTFEILLEYLTPLKIALETIGMEKSPVASLIQPLVRQLLDNYFAFDETDCDVTKQIKHEVQQELETYLNDDYLSTISYLDPRFRNITPKEDHPTIKSRLKAMCSLNAVPPEAAGEPKASTPPAPGATGLSFFFSNKAKRKAPSARDPFDVEFDGYAGRTPDVSFDQRPHDWWTDNARSLPRLRQVAARFLCVPAMLANPKWSLDKQRRFQRNRAHSPVSRAVLLRLHAKRLAGD